MTVAASRTDPAIPPLPLWDLLERVGNTHSRRNLERLLRVAQGVENRLVTFVGAGASKPLGIVGWPQLIQKLLRECNNEDLEKIYSDIVEADSKDEWARIISDHGDRFPEIADEIYDSMDDKERFDNLVLESMEPEYAKCTSALIGMALVVRCHLTTNFDSSLEEAYKIISRVKRCESDEFKAKVHAWHQVRQQAFGQEPHIYYLHADRENRDFILRKTQYDKIYIEDDSIVQTLRSFFGFETVIFVGFSFTDYYVEQAVDRAIKEERESRLQYRQVFGSSSQDRMAQPQHFLLTNTNNKYWERDSSARDQGCNIRETEAMRPFFDRFEKRGILPIVYRRHTFVDELFTYM